jgi:hypothetical protein
VTQLQVSSRRRPYPYDCRIGTSRTGDGGVGFMLVPNRDGQLVSRKAEPLEAQPTSYEYGSQSPFLERTYQWSDLYYGFGERTQPEGRPRRTYYVIGWDMSINGKWIRGWPKFTTETINAGQPIRGFIRALRSGTDTLFALAGTKVRYRVSDGNWADSLTLASGETNQAVRFKNAGGSVVDALYLASTTNNLYRLDGSGTSWALPAALSGPPDSAAQWIETVGDELWVGAGNKIAKCEDDPFGSTADNWAAQITIGDASSVITYLKQNKNALFIFKENGVYTISNAGVDQDVFPTLRFRRSTNNGRNAAVWLDSLWVPFEDAFYRIEADATLSTAGTELLLENDSEVRGRIVATAGHNTWFNYAILYNPQSGDSYLGKYGTWIEQPGAGETRFQDVWFFALKKWTAKQATCIEVVPMGSGVNDRLYVGFADGTAAWAVLPRSSPNPLSDPNCSYEADPGYVYLPRYTAGFAADAKSVHGFSTFGSTIDRENYAQVEYRLSPNAAWTALTTLDADDVTEITADFTLDGQRHDFLPGSDINGKAVEVRVKGIRDPAAAETETLVLDGIAIHAAVRPSLRLLNDFSVDARNHVAKRDGSADRRSARQIRQALLDAVSAVGTVNVVLPTEEVQEMSFVDYSDSLKADNDRRGVEWGQVSVRGVQYRTLSQPGTALGQLTHGDLEQYQHGQLEALI